MAERRSVFVTGHRGLVGLAAVTALERAGHPVVGFDLSDGQDILDPGAVDATMTGARVVVHLAAVQPGVTPSADVLLANVLGTANVLAGAARHGVQKVVVMSSVSALGLHPRHNHPLVSPVEDDHAARPTTDYEWSKHLGEQLCRRYAPLTGIPVVCLRPPVVVGRDEIERVRSKRRVRPELEWRYGWWFGAFIDVEDLADAVVAAVEAPVEGYAAVLVGGPDVASAVPTAELYARLLPSVELRAPDGDLYWPPLDTSRADRLLGWSAQRGWGRDEGESRAARAALRETGRPLAGSDAGLRGRAAVGPWVAPRPVEIGDWSGWLCGVTERDRRAQAWARRAGVTSVCAPWSAVPDLWARQLAVGGIAPFARLAPAPPPRSSPRAAGMAAATLAGARARTAAATLARVGRDRAGSLPGATRVRHTAVVMGNVARWRGLNGSSRATARRPATLAEWAERLEADLRERVLPHWYDTALDHEHGGYLLGEHAWRSVPPVGKQLISQSRMVWGLSLAHRLGLGDATRDYLGAAEQGHDFLERRLRDPVHGGYWWTTLLDGTPSNRRKVLSGQSFVIYALVEHHRASGRLDLLQVAFDLLDAVNRHLHDDEHGGWFEHATEDWTRTVVPDPMAPGLPAYKSGDCHLHLVESFTQLTAVAGEHPGAGTALAALTEAVDVCDRWFFPPDPVASVEHRTASGDPAITATSGRYALGHNVEFAWLLGRAEAALGRAPDVARLDRYVRHALDLGWDDGALVDWVTATGARSSRKTWWVQAELLAALANVVPVTGDPGLEGTMLDLLRFVWRHYRDPRDGMWITALGRHRQPLDASKATEWKGAYHDVRAMVEVVAAFGSGWPHQQPPVGIAPAAIPVPRGPMGTRSASAG